MATSAGSIGRPNEDFAGAVPHAAVLLDGAGIPGTESLCSHGVAWYTHRLGGTLLGLLSREDLLLADSYLLLAGRWRQLTSVPAKTCQASKDFATRLNVI